MSFVVFTLPRSRSAWLSHFLSYRGRRVGHDVGIEATSPADFMARIGDGTCETGTAFAWPLIRRLGPDLRFVVVRRPVDEVLASLGRFGLFGYEAEMRARAAHLADISARPGTLTVQFSDLAREAACRQAFEFCLREPLDRAWWERFDRVNIQLDMAKRLALLDRNRGAIEGLKAAAREAMAHG